MSTIVKKHSTLLLFDSFMLLYPSSNRISARCLASHQTRHCDSGVVVFPRRRGFCILHKRDLALLFGAVRTGRRHTGDWFDVSYDQKISSGLTAVLFRYRGIEIVRFHQDFPGTNKFLEFRIHRYGLIRKRLPVASVPFELASRFHCFYRRSIERNMNVSLAHRASVNGNLDAFVLPKGPCLRYRLGGFSLAVNQFDFLSNDLRVRAFP